MNCAPNHLSIPLGFGAALSDPRQGSRVWRRCKTSPACIGNSRQTHRTALALAERGGRTTDRIHSPGLLGPHHHLRGGPSAPRPARLRKLLQRDQNASHTSEGHADPSRDSEHWDLEIASYSRRTSSPVRPDLMWWTAPVPGIEVR